MRRIDHQQRQMPGHAWNPRPPEAQPEITINERGDDPEDDVAFMARRPVLRPVRGRSHGETSSTSPSSGSSPSPRAPDFRNTVIFTLERQSVAASLPWHNEREMFEQVARAVRVQQSELLQIHMVSHRPPDFIQGEPTGHFGAKGD